MEALRKAYGDRTLTFETIDVPKDPLLGTQRQVASLTYWQNASDNQPRRDYLELTSRLVHAGYAKIMRACHDACGGSKFCIYDAFKMPMQGWNCAQFFDTETSWWADYPDFITGGGVTGRGPAVRYPRLRWAGHPARLPGARHGRRLRAGRHRRFHGAAR